MISIPDSIATNGFGTGTLSPNSGTDLGALAKINDEDSTYLLPDADGTPCDGFSYAYHLDITGQSHTSLDIVIRWLHHLITGNGGGSQTVEQTVSVQLLNGSPNSGTIGFGPAWLQQVFASFDDSIIYDSNDIAPIESFINYTYTLTSGQLAAIVDWEDIWIIISTSNDAPSWCDGVGDESTVYISRLYGLVDEVAGIVVTPTQISWQTVSVSWSGGTSPYTLERKINENPWSIISVDAISPYIDIVSEPQNGDEVCYRITSGDVVSNEGCLDLVVIQQTFNSMLEPYKRTYNRRKGESVSYTENDI